MRSGKFSQKPRPQAGRNTTQKTLFTGLGEFLAKYPYPIFLFLAVLTGTGVFLNFLSFTRLYLFTDIGSDTLNIFYPQYVTYADYMREYGIPSWSFKQGMGQNLFPFSLGDPNILFCSLVGRESIPYCLAYFEWFKILLAGSVFYLFLRELAFAPAVRITGALFYAFSGFMIIGGTWYVFSYEAICLALLLFSFERAFQSGDFRWLPLPYAMLAAFQPVYLLTHTLILLLYGTIRFFQSRSGFPAFAALWARSALAAALGAGIAFVLFYADIIQMLQSPRGSGSVSSFDKLIGLPVFESFTGLERLTFIMRSLSYDLLGNGTGFKGWGNYLEAPMTYCGLLSIPLVFAAGGTADSRKRLVLAAGWLAMLLFFIFPFFRHAFWGFTGDYYRGISLLFIVITLYTASEGLDQLIRNRVNPLFLGAGLLFVLFLLLFPYEQKSFVNHKVQNSLLFFVFLYGIVLFLLTQVTLRPLASVLLICLAVSEIFIFSRAATGKREALSSNTWEQRTGYNDYTVDAVKYLKSNDSTFYRVNKDYSSSPAMHGSINDGMVQGYFGTSSYNSFNQKHYITFLQQLGVIDTVNEFSTRWASGLVTRPILGSMGGVRYWLSKSAKAQHVKDFGYDSVAVFGDVKVLRNRMALPLAFTYNEAMTESVFRSVKIPFKKDLSLLQFGIVPDSIKGHFTKADTNRIVPVFNLMVYDSLVKQRSVQPVRITRFSENSISAEASFSKPQLVFWSIPYDENWKISDKGDPVKFYKANFGFIGFEAAEGEHRFELKYDPYFWGGSIFISLISLLIYAGGFIYLTKKRKG